MLQLFFFNAQMILFNHESLAYYHKIAYIYNEFTPNNNPNISNCYE